MVHHSNEHFNSKREQLRRHLAEQKAAEKGQLAAKPPAAQPEDHPAGQAAAQAQLTAKAHSSSPISHLSNSLTSGDSEASWAHTAITTGLGGGIIAAGLIGSHYLPNQDRHKLDQEKENLSQPLDTESMKQFYPERKILAEPNGIVREPKMIPLPPGEEIERN